MKILKKLLICMLVLSMTAGISCVCADEAEDSSWTENFEAYEQDYMLGQSQTEYNWKIQVSNKSDKNCVYVDTEADGNKRLKVIKNAKSNADANANKIMLFKYFENVPNTGVYSLAYDIEYDKVPVATTTALFNVLRDSAGYWLNQVIQYGKGDGVELKSMSGAINLGKRITANKKYRVRYVIDFDRKKIFSSYEEPDGIVYPCNETYGAPVSFKMDATGLSELWFQLDNQCATSDSEDPTVFYLDNIKLQKESDSWNSYNDDFSVYDEGTVFAIGTGANQINGWEVKTDSGVSGNKAILTDNAYVEKQENGNKRLKVVHASANSVDVRKYFDPMPGSGIVTFEYDLEFESMVVYAAAYFNGLMTSDGNCIMQYNLDKGKLNDKQGGNLNKDNMAFELGKVYHIKYAVDFTNHKYASSCTADGITYFQATGPCDFMVDTTAPVKQFVFRCQAPGTEASNPFVYYIDNFKVTQSQATSLESSSVVNGQNNVPIDGDIILNFNNALNTDTINKIKIEDENGDVLTTVTPVENGEKSVRLVITKPLDYLGNYKIIIPADVIDANGLYVTPATIEFMAEDEPPKISVSAPEVKNAQGEAIMSLAGLKAVTVSADYKNNSAIPNSDVAMIAAIYDESSNLKAIAYDETNIGVGMTETLKVSFDMQKEMTAGYSIKVFAWDSFKSMNPIANTETFPK